MNANFQQKGFDEPRLPTRRGLESPHVLFDRKERSNDCLEPGSSWLVDLVALARCRELLAHACFPEKKFLPVSHSSASSSASHLSFIDVPAAYDNFCQAHFGSLKRLHPDMSWETVCPVYAIALIAHSMLHVELSENRETQLDRHWPEIRGQSTLAWSQARSLIADGCRALARIDPLASAL